MITAEFKVSHVTLRENDHAEVVMHPTMNNAAFTKYTPSGELKFMCTNPAVNAQLIPGKVFRLTFEEV